MAVVGHSPIVVVVVQVLVLVLVLVLVPRFFRAIMAAENVYEYAHEHDNDEEYERTSNNWFLYPDNEIARALLTPARPLCSL